jgi:predicted metalloprotease with PDZ domain
VIADLEWNQVLFYPAGYASRAITVRPGVKLPQGWQFATALVLRIRAQVAKSNFNR